VIEIDRSRPTRNQTEHDFQPRAGTPRSIPRIFLSGRVSDRRRFLNALRPEKAAKKQDPIIHLKNGTINFPWQPIPEPAMQFRPGTGFALEKN
jgi:hypothetical protein